MASPYQYNADKLSDSHFEPGSLKHLVVGNQGRALDYRRTPVGIQELRESSGLVIFEILDFEDKGNTWEIPFEEIGSFQFALDSECPDQRSVARYAAIAERLDRQIEIPCDEDARQTTLLELGEAELDARKWLCRSSKALRAGIQPDFSRKEGLNNLFEDIESYMKHHDLGANESAFAAHYVCKFHYSECVKAQRMVIAEMGLVPYEGKILREQRETQGKFSRERRRNYVVRRLAVVRALYRELGISSIVLYRGVHSAGLPTRPPNRTFVSATTNRAIAESLACLEAPSNKNKPGYRVGVLMSQEIPLERIFMTYMETRQMNHPYRESEAVLLFEADEAF